MLISAAYVSISRLQYYPIHPSGCIHCSAVAAAAAAAAAVAAAQAEAAAAAAGVAFSDTTFILISFLCRYRRECGRAYPSSPTECPLISFFPFVPNAFSLFLLARRPPPIASSFPAFSFFLSPHLGRLRSLSFSSCRLSFEAHAGHPIEKQGQ